MSGAALLLPGQGSQYVGMGHDLAEAHDVVRALYERADDVIGESIGRVSWEGPEEELTATQNAQPAILIHSYAVWTLTRDTVEPIAVTAGHSLGELSAHLIAGTFSFEDAVRLVRRRGELMAAAGAERPGTMAAVLGLDETRIGEICDRVDSGIVVPANLNAPGQIVISGDVDAVARASALAEQSGARRVVPLNVSGAFHSPLMESAANGLEAVLGEIELSDPAVPVVANATGAPVRTATEALDTLVAQLTSPVRWIECVETMRTVEPSEWIELGPGAVLSGLIRRVDRSLRGASIGDVASVEARLGATDDDAE
ncbi:MAG: ACP S-malonyltransferase [Gemmatimonadetes bacterium]|nr:ACP S-malonyltransferase [Gemmatimonadota bacterium]